MGVGRRLRRKRERRGGRLLGSAPPSERDFELMERAGYDVGDEADVVLGSMALAAARIVARRVWPQAGGSVRQVGRNQPCPCGSGRKFKACCLGKERAGAVRSEATEGRIMAIVPVVGRESDEGPMYERLADLLVEDPDLRDVRLPAETIDAFLAQEMVGKPEDDEFDHDAFDEAVEGFLVRERVGVPRGAWETLLSVAPLYDAEPEKLRVIALGLVYVEMGAVAPSDWVNPLLDMLLRIGLDEAADERADLERRREALSESIRGGEDGRALLASVCDELEALIRDAEPEEARELVLGREDLMERLSKLMLSGDFPVRFHFLSALPLLLVMVHEEPGGEAPALSAAMVAAAATDIHFEDVALYATLLDQWLEEEAGEDALLDRAVRLVRRLIDIDAFEAGAPSALLAWVFQGLSHRLTGEEEMLRAESLVDPLAPAVLRRYVQFIADLGFPAIADRTRQIAEQREAELAVDSDS